MPDSFADLFGPIDPSEPIEPGQAAVRLALAAALGFAVAGFHTFNARHRPNALALGGTLVLLSMLIAMVTMAVGNNAAVAFTLVGTLAIVRFRTNVRDIRDTAFVIFAVAVGIASGAAPMVIAIIGCVLVGGVSLLVTQSQDAGASTGPNPGRLTLRATGSGPHESTIDPVIASGARSHRLVSIRIDREGNTRMEYEIDCARASAGDLLSGLNAVHSVTRVALSFGDEAQNDT